MPDQAALLAAYCATRYVVPVLGLTLRVGQHSSKLDERLGHYGAWMFISACNPFSQAVLCGHENLARHQNLLDALQAADLAFFEGYGEGDDGQWPAEPSALVMGVDPTTARQWGQRFEQNAVLWAEAGGTVQLVWCRPG